MFARVPDGGDLRIIWGEEESDSVERFCLVFGDYQTARVAARTRQRSTIRYFDKTKAMIRILVVHPMQLICSLYASVFDDKPSMEVVAQATEVDEALRIIEEVELDIALVSTTLPDNGALQLTKEVAESDPELKVIIVGLPELKNAILQYVMAGASGYVLQDVPVEKLFQNVKAVQEDKALVSPAMAAAFMEHISELANISARPYLEPDVYSELTPREREILELIGQRLTNRDIADKLFIEVGTVKNHVHNILNKLDVSSREDAAAHLPFIQAEDSEA